MGWLRTVDPGHVCELPNDELHSDPNDGKKDEGSVWICEECQTIWVVVPSHGDYYYLTFERITPRLRKKYKL